MTQQVQFQLIDDSILTTIEPQVIYQQYAILRNEFVNAVLYVEQTFDLSSPLATQLQQSINQNRLYRDEYMKNNGELQLIQQKALVQSQTIRKMEKEFENKKADTLEEQKTLQNQLERAINESNTSRDNIKKTYVTLEEEFDNLLRESLSELVENISNQKHEVEVLEGQKKQIEQQQVEGNLEELQALLEKKVTKKDTLERIQDKEAFIEKLQRDNAEMDKLLEQLRKQANEKRMEEDKVNEEKIVKTFPKLNHAANIEEQLIVDWFMRYNIEVEDFKTSFNDGLLVSQVIDKIKPGTINWSLLSKPKNGKSLNIFQRRTNCTVLCDTVQTLGLTQTGIGAQDFTDGNVKMLMGFFRTLMIWESDMKKTLLN
ncbi:Calponin-homology (CH) domain-containing protein [Entamoeba marina]